MKFINQVNLALIRPTQVVTGKRISYYSSMPIVKGITLYSVTPERMILFRTGKTTCTKLRRAIMVLHVVPLIRYIIATYRQ
jgi:hypothetical protein